MVVLWKTMATKCGEKKASLLSTSILPLTPLALLKYLFYLKNFSTVFFFSPSLFLFHHDTKGKFFFCLQLCTKGIWFNTFPNVQNEKLWNQCINYWSVKRGATFLVSPSIYSIHLIISNGLYFTRIALCAYRVCLYQISHQFIDWLLTSYVFFFCLLFSHPAATAVGMEANK